MRRTQLQRLIKEIVKTYIKETPDRIEVETTNGGKISLWFTDLKYISAVFIVYKINGKDIYFTYSPADRQIFSNNTGYEKIINDAIEMEKKDPYYNGDYVIHATMRSYIMTTLRLAPAQYQRITHGRLFHYNGQYFASFWEPLETVKAHAGIIKEFLKDFDTNPQNVVFEPSGFEGDFQTWGQVFGSEKADEPSMDQLTIQQKQELHMNPELKKKVLNLPPHKLKKVADKIGMPFAQFKQYMGMSVAENEQG